MSGVAGAERRSLPFGFSIVAAAFGVQAVVVGFSMAAYPVFMESLEAEFGIGRALASLGLPALLSAGALVSPWVGRRLDRGAPRRVMSAGALILSAGLIGVSQAPSFGVAAVFWLGFVGVGQAMLGPLAAMTLLANWFVARRARMIAIAAMGGTLGGAAGPPLCAFLLEQLGWRTAALSLGVACSAIALPIVLLAVVKRPEDVGAHPDGAAQAPREETTLASDTPTGVFLGDPRFWLLAGGIALAGGTIISFATHVIHWAGERGLSPEAAVGMLTLNSLVGVLGKLLFGELTDRFGPRVAFLIGVGLVACGWSGMTTLSAASAFAVSVAVFALGAGCMVPCQAGFVAALYGRANFGRASGLLHLVSMGGSLALPPLIGLAWERYGSYAIPMTAMLAVIACAALCFALVSPRARREVDGMVAGEPAAP